MDKILLHGVEVYGRHGVNPEEKTDEQPFLFDVELTTDLSNACRSDDLADTVSYAAVNKLLIRIVREQSFDLLERLAEVLCAAILEEFPPVHAVRLRVKKPQAPMRGTFEWVGVEIERSRPA